MRFATFAPTVSTFLLTFVSADAFRIEVVGNAGEGSTSADFRRDGYGEVYDALETAGYHFAHVSNGGQVWRRA